MDHVRKYILKKVGHAGTLTKVTSAISNRMQVMSDAGKSGIVSFKLKQVTKGDQHDYACELLYNKVGVDGINKADSKTINLQVLGK